jgi:hypothetical protein
MSDQPLTLIVLAQFHRQVILPDIERVVGGAEARLRNEMHTLHDFVLTRLDRLETEYEAVKVGLRRLEDRFEQVDARFEQIDARLERIEGR